MPRKNRKTLTTWSRFLGIRRLVWTLTQLWFWIKYQTKYKHCFLHLLLDAVCMQKFIEKRSATLTRNKMEAHRSPIPNSRKKKNVLKKPLVSGKKRMQEKNKTERSQSIHYNSPTWTSSKQLSTWLLSKNYNLLYVLIVIFLSRA